MKCYIEKRKRCPLFDGIAEEELSKMLLCLGGRRKTYLKGECIAAEGEPLKEIGIVLSGTVLIEQNDYCGNRSIIAHLETGELFGESFACADVEWLSVNVIAGEDTEVLFLDFRRITQTCTGSCEFHSRMIYNLAKILAEKNLLLQQKVQVISRRTTREKLLAYLDLQIKRTQSKRFSIPFDRQGLADYLGVDRSGLSVEIGKLKREGHLQVKGNQFEVL